MTPEIENYIAEIVDPALHDFAQHAWARRHAFAACVFLFHTIDYFPAPPSARIRREQFGKASSDFRLIDRVAHAFKHAKTGNDKNRINPLLKSEQIYSRPPASIGQLAIGISIIGDFTGGVNIAGENNSDLLQAAQRTRIFLMNEADLISSDGARHARADI